MADHARPLQTIRMGEVEIATAVEGDGPTLVMSPSYGRDGLADFDHVAEGLAAAGWRVLRPRPRGVAGSSGPMHGPDLKDLAGDVAGVVRQLGGAPAVVLGYAFGNIVARVLAVERPDLIRGVILAAASASPGKVSPEVNHT